MPMDDELDAEHRRTASVSNTPASRRFPSTSASSSSSLRVTRSSAASNRSAPALPPVAFSTPANASNSDRLSDTTTSSSTTASTRHTSLFSASPISSTIASSLSFPASTSSAAVKRKRTRGEEEDADRSTLTPDSNLPTTRKGKSGAKVTSSQTTASKRARKTSATASVVVSSSKGKGRKRPVSPSSPPSRAPATRGKHQKVATGAYNLRPRTNERSTPSAPSGSSTRNKVAGKMADKKASSTSMTAESPSARKGKGKAKAKAARPLQASETRQAEAGPSTFAAPDDEKKESDEEMRGGDVMEVDDEGEDDHFEIEEEWQDEDEECEGEGEAHDGEDVDEGEEDSFDEDDEDIDEEDVGAYGDEDDGPFGGSGAGGHDGSGYGLHLRAFSGYVSGLNARFRKFLTQLRDSKNPYEQLEGLQQLAEVLSMSTEDTLSPYFPLNDFVKELIYLLGGPKPERPRASRRSGAAASTDSAGEAADTTAPDDVDDEAAIAIARASMGEDAKVQMELLACRCLANLMEALPGTAPIVVSHKAVPVLVSKMTEIAFTGVLDVAEQTLSTLEKVSEERPSEIVKEGGLSALLNYLDFFSTHVQRTALTAAANCCRKVSPEYFPMVRDAIPKIQEVLGNPDQRLVEQACLCVVRVIESYQHHVDKLEELLVSPRDDKVPSSTLLNAVNALLLPSSSASSTTNTSISTYTYAQLLHVLSIAVKASPTVAVHLLEMNVVETLYNLLTGYPPPAANEPVQLPVAEPDSANADGQTNAEKAAVAVTNGGRGVTVADMAVLQNLANRPKEQIQETLSLVCELLPPLSKDGVFDPKTYTEKGLRRARHKAEKERAASKEKGKANVAAPEGSPAAPHVDDQVVPGPSSKAGPSASSERAERDAEKEAANNRRADMLRERGALVKRFTQLVLPTLVEVYAASVAMNTRKLAVLGMLKIVSFVERDALLDVLNDVSLASFLGSILSSKDDDSLVTGALQMVELLLIRLPSTYGPAFRREGVTHEVDNLAAQELSSERRRKEANEQARGAKAEASASEPKVDTTPAKTSPTDDTSAVSSSNPGATSTSVPSSAIASLASAVSGGEAIRSRSSRGLETPEEAKQRIRDSNICRARLIKSCYFGGKGSSAESDMLLEMKRLVARLSGEAENDCSVAQQTLSNVAALFAGDDSPTGFELTQSGLVEGLYSFATRTSEEVPVSSRRRMLLNAFMTADPTGTDVASAFNTLVKKLQDNLGRLERFEIVTALGTTGEDKRSSTSMLARQLRLKLMADDPNGVPRSCTNVIVSIHAIATFQALHDYLRPKIAASLSGELGGGPRLSGVLAAFAAATGLPANALAGRSATLGALTDAVAGSSPGASTSARAPTTSTDAEAGSSSRQEKTGMAPRRRSSRLSGRTSPDAAEANNATGVSAESQQDVSGDGEEDSEDQRAARALLEEYMREGLDEGFSDEEYEDDVFDDGLDNHPLPGEGAGEDKTVNLEPPAEGSKMEARTPDGTRVATPMTEPGPSTGARGTAPAAPRRSYSAALQKKTTDWHLEITIEGQPVSLDTTVYGAVHQIHSSDPSVRQASFWTKVYNVRYKRVPGPPPAATPQDTPEPAEVEQTSAVVLPSSVSPEAPFANILQLLRVLYELNVEWRESYHSSSVAGVPAVPPPLPETAFVNNNLTAKLNRQLEEPMIVASSCLPHWCQDFPQYFPFLFPFESRYAFLQSTSFGYARLINKWQTQQARSQDNASRRDNSWDYLGRLQRHKVRISRERLLESAFRVFELYGASSWVLEVEYFDEVGTGLGPTLEFYSLASKEFARKDLKVWRGSEEATTSDYVHDPRGLFPSPAVEEDTESEVAKRRDTVFRTLGQFVAKALLDSRIIDIHFNPIFMKLILGQTVPRTIATLKHVDPSLAASLQQMQKFVDRKRAIEADASMADTEKKAAIQDIRINDASVDNLALDFTLPGYDIELRSGGAEESVTINNIEEYIALVLDFALYKGIRRQIRTFRHGFSMLFPVRDLQCFTPEELVMLFGNGDEDWSVEALAEAIKADHGFNKDSKSIRDLIEIMSSYDGASRREFLQFITGSPKLPIGGFNGLNPSFTVVRKPHEPPLGPDDYLPSVMSCSNYFKLPEYSSLEVMREKIRTAMQEGKGSFHLS